LGGLIRIGAERKQDEAVIAVFDTGIGIAPTELDTIFELYSQAGQAGTERCADGLGIGLYLVRLIAEAHGGTIRAWSAGPGCGSEFVIRPPCKASASVAQASANA
jgi:signal transduction histidine kinase